MRSEKEKMISGELYNAYDEELVSDRVRIRRLLHEYNATKAYETERRRELLGRILNAEGGIIIEPPFFCDYGYNIRIGKNFYANFSCTILDVARVTIGSNVMFGPNVQIYTATHPLDPDERKRGLELARGIVIGDNVWLAGGVIVCPGVSIGDDTTIGAGSVVTRDIPARVFAAGNPCRVIRSL